MSFLALFIEKNRLNIMCFHATVRMMMDCLGLERVSYRDMNEMNGIEAHAFRGNSVEALRTIIRHCDLELDFIKYDDDVPKEDFTSTLYSFIESSFPGFMAFQLEERESKHVVPVFGHTINYDLWTPIGEDAYRISMNFKAAHLSHKNLISNKLWSNLANATTQMTSFGSRRSRVRIFIWARRAWINFI